MSREGVRCSRVYLAAYGDAECSLPLVRTCDRWTGADMRRAMLQDGLMVRLVRTSAGTVLSPPSRRRPPIEPREKRAGMARQWLNGFNGHRIINPLPTRIVRVSVEH